MLAALLLYSSTQEKGQTALCKQTPRLQGLKGWCHPQAQGFAAAMVASHGPDDCVQRLINSTAMGAGFGVFAGAVTANWTDRLAIVDNKAWPAFKRVGAAHFCLALADAS